VEKSQKLGFWGGGGETQILGRFGNDIPTPRDEYAVFGNRLQKGIFGKREEWRRLGNVEIWNLSSG